MPPHEPFRHRLRRLVALCHLPALLLAAMVILAAVFEATLYGGVDWPTKAPIALLLAALALRVVASRQAG